MDRTETVTSGDLNLVGSPTFAVSQGSSLPFTTFTCTSTEVVLVANPFLGTPEDWSYSFLRQQQDELFELDRVIPTLSDEAEPIWPPSILDVLERALEQAPAIRQEATEEWAARIASQAGILND